MKELREHIKQRIRALEDKSIGLGINLKFDEAKLLQERIDELYDVITFMDNAAYDEIGEKLK